MATPLDPSLIPNPTRPFDPARLALRAVRPEQDNTLFVALGNDHQGFINSSAPNISLPGASHAKSYMDYVANEALVGAVIWLRDDATGGTRMSAPTWAPSNVERRSNNDAINSPSTFTTSQPLPSDWGTAIGVLHLSRLTLSTTHHRRTDIGITILPAYQGRGYGREVIEVHIQAFEWNVGALRLYEKIGFKAEGREREAFWHEGRWWDGVDMGMLEGEWWDMTRKSEGKEKLCRYSPKLVSV
ncbi:hypothetical protein COCMIDRAFT_40689 [Bipolaris oryzae ATCC 44560]|uniref:N-acetyltransferase domain-containing protein n=1 Tax=Bipolaris oryzae ATCC 44560 TaxID=930090 RepID=W6YNW2_COCMI|nr:uncharacterized protein COCMIDRAFT_40689 [Bipolaris oryzae ATCC 44560]EUC41082.1 hypothetical protein COCMIDRAFT_40689 [Bipolaris oryzae ATCC 44560]